MKLLLFSTIILPLLELNAARSNIPTTIYKKRFFGARGGSTIVQEKDDEDAVINKEVMALGKYRMEQQELLQIRSIILSEALAERGLPMKTRTEVSTVVGKEEPEVIDWDCAMSTTKEPKTCLISFDAEPHTKVIAPIDTDMWISLAVLNRLRRKDPTKIEPMWYSKYAILKSWFNDESSNYCILQHCGVEGIVLAILLNNPQKSVVLKSLLGIALSGMILLVLPLLNFIVNRFAVSSLVWMNWMKWARFVHAPFPLKLYLAQLAWKGLAKVFNNIEKRVRDFLIELECTILEERMPLTVGPGSQQINTNSEEDDEEEEAEYSIDSDEDSDSDDSSDSDDDSDSDFE